MTPHLPETLPNDDKPPNLTRGGQMSRLTAAVVATVLVFVMGETITNTTSGLARSITGVFADDGCLSWTRKDERKEAQWRKPISRKARIMTTGTQCPTCGNAASMHYKDGACPR